MSDEAGSVSVSILGDLKPFEDALRAAEKRADDFVKRIEAITGKMRPAASGLGGTATEEQRSADRITQMHRSLTRELTREGNARAAETKRVLAQQERDNKAAIDKQIADRKRLASAMLQDAHEHAAINRRIAAEETERQKTHFKADQNRRFLASQASYQVSDVVSGLAMGQSPMMIATQQGGQIYDLFQRGGGIKPTLEALGSALKFAINPIFLATSAIAGLGIIAGTAAYKFDTMMRGLNNSTQLGGRSSGATASSLYGIASRQTELSTSSAADVVGIFASAGVNVGVIATMTDHVKKFSRATGQEAPDAARELASALADPAKGVDDLAKRMGGFDVAVVQNVKNLAAQGDRLGAQRALADAFGRALDAANIEINKAAAGWEKIGKAISDIYNATGRSVSAAIFGEEDDDRLARAKKVIAEVEKLSSYKSRRGQSISPEDKMELESARAIVAELENKRKKIEANAEASREEADIQSKASGVRQSGYEVLGLGTKQDLENAAQAYFKLIVAAGSVEAAARAAGMSTEEFNQATYRTQKAADAAVSADEKIVAQHKAAIEMIKARTVEEKILAEQMAIRANAKNTTGDPEAESRRAEERAQAMSQRHASDMLRSANDNAASAGMAGLPKTLKDIDTKYAREIEMATKAGKAIDELREARDREKAAATLNAVSGPTRDATLSINEQIAATRIQATTFGASAGAVAEATERQRLYNQYAREGVAITPELAAGIDGIAKASGRAAQAQDDLNKSQKRIIDDADHIRDAGGGFLKTFINDLAKGKSAAEAFKDALNSLLQKILDRIENNFVDMLFGKSGTVPGGSGDGSIFGGIMGQILGAGKQTAAVGGATGTPMSLGLSALANSRSGDLGNDTISKLFAMTKAEVGGQGGDAQQAFMETIFNRASARGKSVESILSDRAYFPKETFDRAAGISVAGDELARYQGMLSRVRGGSNLSGYATGNASGTVGFGGGPMTLFSGGEKFGIEAPDMTWAQQMKTLDASKITEVNQSLSAMSRSTNLAGDGLGTLGSGFMSFGNQLAGMNIGGGGGGLFGFLGGILGFGGGSSAVTATPTMGGLYADGGIMSRFGNVKLKQYADGGIANSPQISIFGEGSGPEAYVPLKNGGIPVRVLGPKQANTGNFTQTNITVAGSTITVEGNADQKTLDIMRQELDMRDRRISRDLDKNFGNHQRAYSALRAR